MGIPIAPALCGLALSGLGAAKVRGTHLNPFRNSIELPLVGGLAAAVAYAVGALPRGLAG